MSASRTKEHNKAYQSAACLKSENYWHVVRRLSGFNLRSAPRKAEQWRPRPVSAERGPLSVTDWHWTTNTPDALVVTERTNENQFAVCGYLFTPPRCSVILSDFNCLTAGSLFSEIQTVCMLFMRGRNDGYARRENIHKHTLKFRRVMVEIHTNHMLLTLFTILLMLQWKCTASCVILMSTGTCVQQLMIMWSSCTHTGTQRTETSVNVHT